MIAEIDKAKRNGDTVGGIFEIVARGVPPGLGSFGQWDRKLDGRLAQALMSIHAVKAVSVGEGFSAGAGLAEPASTTRSCTTTRAACIVRAIAPEGSRAESRTARSCAPRPS